MAPWVTCHNGKEIYQCFTMSLKPIWKILKRIICIRLFSRLKSKHDKNQYIKTKLKIRNIPQLNLFFNDYGEQSLNHITLISSYKIYVIICRKYISYNELLMENYKSWNSFEFKYKTSSTPPLLIEVSVPRQERVRLCICTLCVSCKIYLFTQLAATVWKPAKYDKREDFNFPIVNFPFICSNIPATPAYGVHISQFIGYSRVCGTYHDFLQRVAANMEANEPRVPSGSVDIITSKILQSPPTIWLTVTEYRCIFFYLM